MLQMRFEELKKQKRRQTKVVDQLDELLRLLRNSAEMRKQSLDRIRRMTEQRVMIRFGNLMWRKGHTGHIKIIPGTQCEPGQLSLEVSIGARDPSKKQAVKDLKQLSGEERCPVYKTLLLPTAVCAILVALRKAMHVMVKSQPSSTPPCVVQMGASDPSKNQAVKDLKQLSGEEGSAG